MSRWRSAGTKDLFGLKKFGLNLMPIRLGNFNFSRNGRLCALPSHVEQIVYLRF